MWLDQGELKKCGISAECAEMQFTNILDWNKNHGITSEPTGDQQGLHMVRMKAIQNGVASGLLWSSKINT